MRQKSMSKQAPAEKAVRDIRRKTRRKHSTEEKIRIVLEGLRGEESIAALSRREGIAESLYHSWSKEFLEAGKKRLAGGTARQATSNEVKTLRAEARDLKEALAKQMLENRFLKKSMSDNGSSSISSDLAEWLKDQKMDHVRGDTIPSANPGQDRMLASNAEEPDLAGELLPTW